MVLTIIGLYLKLLKYRLTIREKIIDNKFFMPIDFLIIQVIVLEMLLMATTRMMVAMMNEL